MASPDPQSAERAKAEARGRLLRLLKYRPRSTAEARRRLQQAGFPPEIVDEVLNEAQARGWLDDAAFARLWVRDRLQRRPVSPALLARELRARGLPEEVIERALKEETRDWDEAEALRALAEDALSRYRHRGLDPETLKRRLYAFLRRRGFSPEAIRRVLRSLHP